MVVLSSFIFNLIEFDKLEGSFELDLQGAEENSWLYLVVEPSPGIAAVDTWEWVRECLIADARIVDDLKKRRTLGVERKLVQGTEAIDFEVGEKAVIVSIKLATDILGPDDRLSIRSQGSPSNIVPKAISLYSFGQV